MRLLTIVVAEDILESGVHARLIRDLCVVGAAFVDDLQRDAVLDRLAHRVFVDVVAEDPLRLVDGRAGVADASRFWNCFIEICSQHGILRAMGFVRHHEDVRANVQFREGLLQIQLAELVDHRHDEVGGIGRQQFLQRLDAIGDLHGEADALTGFGKLVFQLGSVGDEDHLPF